MTFPSFILGSAAIYCVSREFPYRRTTPVRGAYMAEEIKLVDMTITVVANYVAHNNLRPGEVPDFIAKTHAAIAASRGARTGSRRRGARPAGASACGHDPQEPGVARAHPLHDQRQAVQDAEAAHQPSRDDAGRVPGAVRAQGGLSDDGARLQRAAARGSKDARASSSHNCATPRSTRWTPGTGRRSTPPRNPPASCSTPNDTPRPVLGGRARGP